MRIYGRGKCRELIDCSAHIEGWGGQVQSSTIKSLAERLCEPYDIEVSDQVGGNVMFPTFNVTLGETAYDILERVARSLGVLLYEDELGRLVIARGMKAEGGTPTGGFRMGHNIEEADADESVDQQYSQILVWWQQVDSQAERRNNLHGVAFNRDIEQNRRLYIFSDQLLDGVDIAQARATWEVNRRRGRSEAVQIVSSYDDSRSPWRDDAGGLFQPNTLATVHIPDLYLNNKTWLVAELAFVRDASRGTVLDVTMMPSEAFDIAPYVLSPYNADTTQAIEESRSTPVPGDTP